MSSATTLAPKQSAASTAKPHGISPPSSIGGSETSNRRIPVTPSMLRSIFASSRTIMEERSISRVAFFRFAGFVLSCVMISVAAAKNRGRPAVGIPIVI